MDFKKFFWGALLILIGGTIVLRNLDIISFEWRQLWQLWPLIFILWGIAMLPIHGGIKLLASVLAIAGGVILVNKYDTGKGVFFERPFRFRYDNDWKRNDREEEKNEKKSRIENWESQRLVFPYSANIQKATLKLDAAAGVFNLKDFSDDNLVDMVKEGNIGTYSLTASEEDDMHIVRLTLNEGGILSGKDLKHKVDIKLHKDPVWDFKFNIGAAKVEMDLSNFKINHVDIDGGASSISLRLGNQHPVTNVEIDAGASSLTIEVPFDAGCQVKTSSFLSGKSLKDFKKLDGNLFETENFNTSKNKIYIRCDVAASNFEVKRY